MQDRLILPCLGAVLLMGCGEAPRRQQQAESPPKAMTVSVVTAANETWPLVYEATGTVRAQMSGTVAARMSGYVREVKARMGEHVREGQLLITLDARDLDVSLKRAEAARDEVRAAMPEADAGIRAAKASLDLAQATSNRMQELFQKQSISNQEFDEANARLKAAEAAQEMARTRRAQLDSRLATAEQEIRAAEVTRSYAEVSAPFEGLVVTRAVEPGNLATPGATLMTIEREGAYRLEAEVEESKVSSIKVGQAMSVALDDQRVVEAHVSEIVPAIDAASRASTVRINLPALQGLRSGMFGRARFQLGSRTLLAIPGSAVVEHGQLESVYVADGGVARMRLVTSGERNKEAVEILSGLTAGEKIVAPIPAGLSDGTPVETGR